jgi:uncharacterized membrane protein YebE (DUF533 family)
MASINNDSANLGTAAATGGGVLGASFASFFSRNVITIALVAALLSVIAYFLYRYYKNKKK